MCLDHICEDLEQVGYKVIPFVIPAAGVGAPHRRDRVWILAHAEGRYDRGEFREFCQKDGGSEQQLHTESCGSGQAVADNLQQQAGRDNKTRFQYEFAGSCKNGLFRERWKTEPDVGRVAHGVPDRVDRLRGLGNAVVPQIPMILGQAIQEAEK